MLAMAFLTPMTVPISRVSKVWERNLSRETLSNIGQHPLHLGFETPVQNHVPQPDHHAGHDLPVDDLLDGEIVAGMVVRLGNVVLDGSLKTKVKGMLAYVRESLSR